MLEVWLITPPVAIEVLESADYWGPQEYRAGTA